MASLDSINFIGADGSRDSRNSFEFVITRSSGSGDASGAVPMIASRHDMGRNNLNIIGNDTERERPLNADPVKSIRNWRSSIVSRKLPNAARVATEIGLIAADIVAITDKAANYVENMKYAKSS